MKYYISITGLTLRGFWHAPKFWYHAMPSFMQAQNALGNVRTEAKAVNGVQHTLTVWDSRKSMIKYLHSGAHAKAMRVFDEIATGKTYGYESDTIPSWSEALQLWEEKGVVYEKQKPGQNKADSSSPSASDGGPVSTPSSS